MEQKVFLERKRDEKSTFCNKNQLNCLRTETKTKTMNGRTGDRNSKCYDIGNGQKNENKNKRKSFDF